MEKKSRPLNLLIVMPRFIDNQGGEYIFPLGIPYISGALKAQGFAVTTLNLNHREDPYTALKNTITSNNIDVVLSGGLSTEFPQVKIIFEVAKKCCDSIITVCGGGMITGDPEAAMEALEYVDYGIIGEGEVTNCELCACFEKNIPQENIDGIIYSEEDSWIKTKPREEIKNIDAIPYPDYEGFELDIYLENHTSSLLDIAGVDKALSLLCSRSCPYNCTFCFHTVGNKYRQRSIDSIFEELDFMMSKHDFDFIFVLDELFASTIERVEEFCRRIVTYNLRWSASFRVDGITDELVQILKGANCQSLCLGLESADNTILKSMRKNITVEQSENALEIIRRNGLSPVGNFIFGDISETKETASNTLQWWKNNQEYTISLKMIRTLPGSYLYKHALANNLIEDRAQFLKDGCPYINVSKMSDSEMRDLTNTISVLDMEKTQNIAYSDIALSNEPGAIDFTWGCPQCGSINSARNVRLFSLSFASCSNCAYKTLPPIPQEIVTNIDSNLEQLLSKTNVGLWGMADYAVELIHKSTVVQNSGVFLIDISQFKQGNYIAEKLIHAPKVIEEKDIDIIVPLVPVFAPTISSYINERFKNKKILSIYDLCDPSIEI